MAARICRLRSLGGAGCDIARSLICSLLSFILGARNDAVKRDENMRVLKPAKTIQSEMPIAEEKNKPSDPSKNHEGRPPGNSTPQAAPPALHLRVKFLASTSTVPPKKVTLNRRYFSMDNSFFLIGLFLGAG